MSKEVIKKMTEGEILVIGLSDEEKDFEKNKQAILLGLYAQKQKGMLIAFQSPNCIFDCILKTNDIFRASESEIDLSEWLDEETINYLRAPNFEGNLDAEELGVHLM